MNDLGAGRCEWALAELCVGWCFTYRDEGCDQATVVNSSLLVLASALDNTVPTAIHLDFRQNRLKKLPHGRDGFSQPRRVTAPFGGSEEMSLPVLRRPLARGSRNEA
ncbi:MAG TPA: hypothetical protein VI136_01065 [Verrucomicrobiae bacterium]